MYTGGEDSKQCKCVPPLPQHKYPTHTSRALVWFCNRAQ
jgi:hypothetical protein